MGSGFIHDSFRKTGLEGSIIRPECKLCQIILALGISTMGTQAIGLN